MNEKRPARWATRMVFLFYSRPVFRAWEIVCNHLARLVENPERMKTPAFQREWARINLRRMEIQRGLGEVSHSHAHVCAQCGHCCKGTRERDAFLDRVIQDPATPLRQARRKEGTMVGVQIAQHENRLLHKGAEPVQGACRELTCQGCRVPNELRPMQCLAYFCGSAVRALSQEECERGIRLLQQLLKLQAEAVRLAFRSRFGRPPRQGVVLLPQSQPTDKRTP